MIEVAERVIQLVREIRVARRAKRAGTFASVSLSCTGAQMLLLGGTTGVVLIVPLPPRWRDEKLIVLAWSFGFGDGNPRR